MDTPVPAPGEVLVRVRATSVNPYDWHGMRGEPRIARLMAGPRAARPEAPVLGCDMAGQVEAVGAGVTEFSPGDDVFALLEKGGFAEYVSVPERPAGTQARELVLRAGGGGADGGRHRAAGPARRGPGRARPEGPRQRGLGRSRHVRRPARPGARRQRRRRVQRRERGPGPRRSAPATSSTTPRKTSPAADGATTCYSTSRGAKGHSRAVGRWRARERWSSSAARPGGGCSRPGTCSPRWRWGRSPDGGPCWPTSSPARRRRSLLATLTRYLEDGQVAPLSTGPTRSATCGKRSATANAATSRAR